jgi:hypothetical protein
MATASVGMMAGSASAAPGDNSHDTVVANIGVNSTILLTGLPGAFTLNGAPGTIVTGLGDVSFNVMTNNIGGYKVTVQAAASALAPTAVGNPDSIPIETLQVREAAANPGAFTSISNGGAVSVHSQATRSAAAGDVLSNDFQIQIPFVATDTYTATLNYIATTL